MSLGLDGLWATFAYDPLVSRLVLTAKNGGRRDLLVLYGRWLASVVDPPGASAGVDPTGDLGGGFDVVTWVPASRRQRRRRGYDQGQVLARAVGRPLGLPSRRLLGRTGPGAQAGRGRSDRLTGPGLRPLRASPSRVLLVDDVVTTGASMARAAAVLRQSGAAVVHAAAVAVVE